MGMFDSFYVPITCPYSGNYVVEAEFQTKEFQCCMEEWRIGDNFTGESCVSFVNGDIKLYGNCRCEECMEWEQQRNKDRKKKGKWGCSYGSGRRIEGVVQIRGGVVVGTKDVEIEY